MPYGAVRLTDAGLARALAVVRRHRLIETWLVQEMGYGWDEVHDEAEVLEHAISDRLLEAIDARLGRPARDPHGDAIPSAAGTLEPRHAVLLADADRGARGRGRAHQRPRPAVLRALDDAGIGLDTVLTVTDAAAASVSVSVAERAHTLLPRRGRGDLGHGVARRCERAASAARVARANARHPPFIGAVICAA